MPAIVVVGAQWGDEGKGKVVDLYSPYAKAVVRYAGGANAGHTLVVNGEKLILHLVPSGILHEGTCVIAQGTVIDPETLLTEVDALTSRGVDAMGRLRISDRAHVVLPHHRAIDALREQGRFAIGTTKRGIGPTYEDKIARRGVRIGDLLKPDVLRERLDALMAAWKPFFGDALNDLPDVESTTKRYAAMGERLAPMIINSARWVGDAVARNERILLEGAQGTLLDIDHGTYPFVTSSTAVAGGACAGAGIGPTAIDAVVGIAKAYTTRVGDGPFPTELHDEMGEALRTAGAEFGSTTGRPRRCGWLDIVALREAVRLSGMTELAITKLDVLTGIPKLQICVAYDLDGERLDDIPLHGLERVKPIYEEIDGWEESIRECRRVEDLPAAARRYLDRVEELSGCKIGPISVGPDREETLSFRDPFTIKA